MDYRLAVITQDRGLEKVMKRISDHFNCDLSLYENCGEFVRSCGEDGQGAVVLDASVCSSPHFLDLQAVVNRAPSWQVIYLPGTNKKSEIKDAMGFGAFGCLHRPVSEQEIRQMVQSALGI